VTAQGVRLVLQQRSPLTSITSSLPAGTDANAFAVRAYVRVFDVLNAASVATFPVTVRPAASQAALLGSLSQAISNANIGGGLQQAVSIATSSINRRNCSDAQNCEARLNRDACSWTEQACGECMDGFYGDVGDGNTLCINATDLAALQGSAGEEAASCAADAECPVWHSCSGGECVPTSKTCLADCSGNGECGYVHAASGFSVQACPLFDFECTARCVCSDGYFGSACSVAAADLAGRASLRTQVLIDIDIDIDIDIISMNMKK
jgi:hypothetical protein